MFQNEWGYSITKRYQVQSQRKRKKNLAYYFTIEYSKRAKEGGGRKSEIDNNERTSVVDVVQIHWLQVEFRGVDALEGPILYSSRVDFLPRKVPEPNEE